MCLAVLGKILEISDNGEFDRIGTISFGGVIKEINLAMVPEAEVGMYILAHAGIAIGIIDEKEAQKTLGIIAAAGKSENDK